MSSKVRKVSDGDDFQVEGLRPPGESAGPPSSGISISRVSDGVKPDETPPMGTFLEWTISNKLNQASQGSIQQRIWCYLDICMCLTGAAELDVLKDGWERPMEVDDALDRMLDFSGSRIAVRMKRERLVQKGGYRDFVNEEYLYYIENLARKAIQEAKTKGVISLEANVKAEYDMVMFNQGGGVRPQPRR